MRPLGVELAVMLKSRGVDVVFGIPGVHNVEMYRGIEEAGIRHMLPRHEQGAGFMADGYARATGRPGVCFTITGPGLTNIMTPLGQAYSDSVPVLVISSCLDETASKRGQLHQMRDQAGAARAVCDWSEAAHSAEAAYALVDRALAEFDLRRPRPKAIHIPIDVLGAPAAAAWPQPDLQVESAYGANVEAVAVMLQTARRVVFVFGGGVSGVIGDRLLQRSGAVAFTTYAGRGVVSDQHPRNLGSFLARASSADVFAMADLIIAVGTELSEVDLWRDALGGTARLVRVDLDPEVLAHPANDVAIQADAGDFLRTLDEALPDTRSDWTDDEVQAWRDKWRAEVNSERPGIVPIADALRQALPKNTMVFSDMTQFAYAAKEVWDMPAPGLWHHPFGFGTLGYALPASIGGAVGYDGPVLAIAGDSGVQYTLPELGTAAELGLSLPVMIWDNNALKEIEDCMVRAQIAPNAVHQLNPDWGAFAAAYGCGFTEPESIADLCNAVVAAFDAGRPTVIRATPNLR